MAHFRQGNMEAAQANFDAFLVLQPNSGPALFRISLIRARQSRFRAAIVLARRALAQAPDQAEILTHLARCLLMCGQLESARSIATRALSFPRENAAALDLLAAVMTRLNEQVLAKQLFDEAIALDPTQASLYFNRALAQKQFGFADAAEPDLETCIKLSPDHAKAHWTLAVLRPQDQMHNHIARLRACLARSTRGTSDDELLALALFKELDDLADVEAAWTALDRGIGSRRARRIASGHDREFSPDALIEICDETFCSARASEKSGAGTVFVFGMPRAGVPTLGNLLSKHAMIQHVGTLAAFSRLVSEQLGRDSGLPFDAVTFEKCRTLDFEQLGLRYLRAVSPANGKQLLICESQPMNFLLAAFIARALPGARMLHLVRDPTDVCVSILGHAGGEAEIPCHDPGKLAEYYLAYDRLIQHWHKALPGSIMDVSFESLVEKPEMVLRVVCGFLGIRYASAMHMDLRQQANSIGRGRRYISRLPALSAGLKPILGSSRNG